MTKTTILLLFISLICVNINNHLMRKDIKILYENTTKLNEDISILFSLQSIQGKILLTNLTYLHIKTRQLSQNEIDTLNVITLLYTNKAKL